MRGLFNPGVQVYGLSTSTSIDVIRSPYCYYLLSSERIRIAKHDTSGFVLVWRLLLRGPVNETSAYGASDVNLITKRQRVV